jgi:hypothetical protein
MAKRFSVVVLAAGSLLGFTAAAQAVGACDSGAFCAYTAENFNDTYAHLEMFAANSDWPSSIDDGENSVWNNGTITAPVRVYDSTGYNDAHYCVYRTHRLNLPSDKDEDGQSHKWVSGITGCY